MRKEIYFIFYTVSVEPTTAVVVKKKKSTVKQKILEKEEKRKEEMLRRAEMKQEGEEEDDDDDEVMQIEQCLFSLLFISVIWFPVTLGMYPTIFWIP